MYSGGRSSSPCRVGVAQQSRLDARADRCRVQSAERTTSQFDECDSGFDRLRDCGCTGRWQSEILRGYLWPRQEAREVDCRSLRREDLRGCERVRSLWMGTALGSAAAITPIADTPRIYMHEA